MPLKNDPECRELVNTSELTPNSSGVFEDGRLTAVSRTVLFILATLVLWNLTSWLMLAATSDRLMLILFSLFPAVFISTYLLLFIGGYRSLTSIGIALNRESVNSIGCGIGLGCGLVVVIIGWHWVLGWAKISTVNSIHYTEDLWTPNLLIGVVGILVGSVGEELLMRGYGFQQLARATHPWTAVVITSVFFGWIHQDNPGVSWLALINTALFGILFGLSLVRHRTLWLPCGIHTGWNLSLAALGANLSGLRIKLTVIHTTAIGPELWTGGEYGPEAGLSATIAVVAASLLVWKLPLFGNGDILLWEKARQTSLG